MCTGHGTHVEVREEHVGSLRPSHGSCCLNSGRWAWWQVLYPLCLLPGFHPSPSKEYVSHVSDFSSTSHLNSGLGINPARWLYISAFWLNSPDVTPVSDWLIASLVSPLKMFTSAPRFQQTDHTTHSHLCLSPFSRETNSPSSPFKHSESSQRCSSHSLQRLSLTGPVS